MCSIKTPNLFLSALTDVFTLTTSGGDPTQPTSFCLEWPIPCSDRILTFPPGTDCIASAGRMTDELEGTWKEAVVA
jgi:hypothetical protein